MTLRKLGTGFLVIVAVLILSIPAIASDRYHLSNLDMSVSLPSDGYVITQELTQDDPIIEKLERSWEEEIQYLQENDLYLEFFHEDPYYDIDISMSETDFAMQHINFNLYDQDYLHQIGTFLVDSDDFDYSSYRLHSVDDVDYIILRGRQTMQKKKANIEDYYTVVDGREIRITLYSYDDVVTDEMTVQLQQVVNSVTYGSDDSANNDFSIQTYDEILELTSSGEIVVSKEDSARPPQLGSDEQNEFIHNVLFWVFLTIFVVLITIIAVAIIRSRKKHNNNDNIIEENKDDIDPSANQ